ncbi:MAG: hypothetical protein OXL34_16885 [Gemmatimonadota bacterium]|nr:hypothetical protein [Gemmatimonadota bacterium]
MSKGMGKCRVVVAVFLSAVACGDDVTEPESLYPATVVVSPETGRTETFADTIHLTATHFSRHSRELGLPTPKTGFPAQPGLFVPHLHLAQAAFPENPFIHGLLVE